VDFFDGTNRVGIGQLTDPGPPHDAGFLFFWTNVPAGQYTLTARATDNRGAQTTSSPVKIIVGSGRPVVNVEASKADAYELGDSKSRALIFRVTRTGPIDFELPVSYRVGGTAQNGVDYEELSGRMIIPIGAREAAILTYARFDEISEGDETVEVAIERPTCNDTPPRECYEVGEHGAAYGLIHDALALRPVVSLELIDPEAMETPGFQNFADWAEFRVLRTSPASEELVVYLNTQQGSARLGEDYWLDGVNNGSTVRFPVGASSMNVRLYPIDDDFYEGDETVFFHLIAPPAGIPLPDQYDIDFAHSSVAMVIHDNDPVTTRLEITAPHDGQEFQPGDIIELRAQIIGQGSSDSWSVDFFADDLRLGTTRPGVPIWWGEASGGRHVITARAYDPAAIPGQDTLVARPVTIQVGPGAPLPVVKISATPWRTSEPCPTCLVVPSVLTIERTAPTNNALTVFLAIDGTATAGDDYQALPASVEIPAGQRSAQLTLLTRDDQLAEGPEVVRVRVRVLRQPPPFLPPTYFVNVYANEVLVVIFDDEPDAPQARLDIAAPTNGSHLLFASTIQLSALAVNTQNEVYGPVEFYAGDQFIARSTVTATTQPATPGLPSVHTAHWTNPPVGQYALTARTRLSFSQSITSPPVNVTVDAPTFPVVSLETFPLQNPQAREFCPPNLDCAYPSFVVRRSGPTNADLSVYLSYSGTATAGADYPSLPGSLVIPAGRDAAFLMLVPNDDTLVEGPETVIATFTAVPAPYIQDPNHASATITIIDNERPLDTVVSIEATQRIAEESSEPFRRLNLVGEFTISRIGPTNNSASVFVRYSGTATPDLDYPSLPGLVTIPSGSVSTEIRVEAINDHLPEGIETLEATLSHCGPGTDPPTGILCLDGFDIDPAHQSATIFIRDDGLTAASLVINRPQEGASFPPGQTILIEATAIDLDGYIGGVEFWDGEQPIGVSSIEFIVAPDPGTPILHSFEWQNAAPGPHILTARASHSDVTMVRSLPVHITVEPVANQPPRITITRPTTGTEFPPNTAIEIIAQGIDPDGFVRKVEFFADGQKIGEQNVVFIQPPEPGQPQTLDFVWRFPTPGPHVLTAHATDNDGAIAWSAPVEIRVTMPDLLPVVRVVARDAFAVEPGSNTALNTATFRIRRFGPTNADLVVNYSLHGTAENGVDYETLSGLATIPTGQRSTTVTVRPLADNLTERIETVILRLEDSPGEQPPTYRIGHPRRAVAVISDLPMLHASADGECLSLPDGLLNVCFAAETGVNFRVEASSDLRNWETLCDSPACDGVLHFVDDEAANLAHRFYRLTPEPVASADE
jgi:hypothetical protein